MTVSKQKNIKRVKWCFESKCSATLHRRYAQEFHARYVKIPHYKFIQYNVQKFMTKGKAHDCRKAKAEAPIQQDLP